MKMMDKYCVLISNMLNVDDQIRLFGDVDMKSRDQEAKEDTKIKAMYPSPKTIAKGCKYKFGENSVYNESVNKANDTC